MRHVPLFRDGRELIICIPAEFEIPGEDVVIRRDGEKLVIEPVHKRGLIAVLNSLAPLAEAFPDTDDGLMPLPDVKL